MRDIRNPETIGSIMSRIWLLAAGLFLCVSAFAQGSPSPVGKLQFLNNNGQPLAGGSLCTFNSGTSSPLATYANYQLTTANPVCITLDAAGRAFVYIGSIVYRFVLKDSVGVTIWTADGIASATPGSSGATAWTVSGTTIYATPTTDSVCVGCTNALAKLNVSGQSSGTNYLIRIDDSGNSPGINLYGSGVSFGSYTADAAGLRLRAPSGSSQAVISQGNFTIQDTSGTGATVLTIKAGSAQGSANPIQVQNNAGTNLGWFDSAGRVVSPLFNSTGATAAIAFQTNTSTFSVNGYGDISANGQINIIGVDDPTNGGGSAALKIGGTSVIDNTGNATFTTLTCTSTPCGSGGGGGGLPVSDATNIVFAAGDATKRLKFDVGGLSTATTRTAAWPDSNITVMGRENTETVSGTKVFSALVTGNAGFAGTNFNATNTTTAFTFQNANSNFLVNGNGDITSSGTAIAQYITSANWFGLHPTASAPGTSPAGGYSAVSYHGGASGLKYWFYDAVHSAWSDVDLAGVAGSGITSINGQTGAAQTIAGTANRVIATTSTDTVTLSTPQDIGTTSNVTFGSVIAATGAFNSAAPGASIAFQTSGTTFQVDGNGNISSTAQVNLAGGSSAYKMGGITFLDSGRNATVNNLTISGTCFGCGGGGGGGVTSAAGTFNQVLVNGGTGAQTGAVTLSLPQAIGTTSVPTFNGIISTGAFNANVGGFSIAFQTASTTFQVNGQGDISAAGQINVNTTGGGGTYKMAGSTVINASRQFVGTGIDVGAGGISSGGYNLQGGFLGQTFNVSIPGMTIGGTGCTGGLIFRGGILVSCF